MMSAKPRVRALLADMARAATALAIAFLLAATSVPHAPAAAGATETADAQVADVSAQEGAVADSILDADGGPSCAAAADDSVPADARRITGFSDLLAAALASRTEDTSGVYYVLDLEEAENGVLDLSSDQVDQIVSQLGSLTFGTKDNPFRGTFDGAGYTIDGLDYHRDLWVPAPDTGLFAWTDGATIKNINFTNAYVGADYRGGVIVGYAHHTRIEHVKLVNCTSSVTPANNAVSLVTNAGLAGGMVAGELDGCSLYDVEVQGGHVVNNSTAAVSGLGGEGLYLGAIAGTAKNTTIEYSRVTPVRTAAEDGTVSYAYTHVDNKYDVAVGAVAGQAVYAGGIVGSLYENGSIVDCFSTADCYTYAATYVSVGAGNVGYVGGLAARTDDTTYLVRSHYAGNLHSYLYNALLVIPIIQRNAYLGGLIEWDNDDGASISECFFNTARSKNDPEDDKAHEKSIPAVGIDERVAGPSFGEQGDEAYVDRLFWEEHGYDFTGGTSRTTGALGGAEHVNEWVMDYDLGMPVHGDSVKATLDYPGAGAATIGAADVLASQTPQTTEVPYDFAVQGFVADDLDLEFKAETNAVSPETAPLVSDADGVGYDNEGYAFRGWYREPDVAANHIDASHDFFEPIVGDEGKLVSAEASYVARNQGPGASDGFAGDDLFVAYFQGQVLFHNVAGGVVELDGAPSTGTDDDWYDHAATLPECAEPSADRAGNGVSATARLIGWTSDKNPATGGGWPAVTSTALGDMKNSGHFFTAGDAIAEPMDLYPVYSDFTTNIVTVFEGNEQDAFDDKTLRDGVGRTDVVAEGDVYTVTVSGAGDNGAFPEGYRFLGWYETDEAGDEWRVSSETAYTLPADADLTREHVYTARFEYRVQAWLPTERPGHQDEYCYKDYYSNDANPDIGLFETAWLAYGSTGAQVAAALDVPAVRDEFHYWTDHGAMLGYGPYSDDFIVNIDELDDMRNHTDELFDIATGMAALTAPVDVDAVVTYTKDSNYDVVTFSDFPRSTDKYDLRFFLSRGQIDVTAKPGYRISGILRFTTEIDGFDTTSHYGHNDTQSLDWNGRDAVWDDFGDVYSMDHQNVYLLKASADVNFYDLQGGLILTPTSPRDLSSRFTSPDEPEAFPDEATATRKYDALLFNPEGAATQPEVSPFTMLESTSFGDRDVPVGLGDVDADIDPVQPGAAADPVTGDASGRFICVDGVYYGFLGWTSPADLSAAERAHAFVDGVPSLGACGYVATSADNAVPYLLDADTRVRQAMDVYPVYAKFDIETTTNIARAGIPEGSGVNVPLDPSCSVANADDGSFTASLAADVWTKVSDGGDALYRLVSFTVERDDGSVETLAPVQSAANEFSYTVRPGEHYVFVAHYEPLAVVYHVGEGRTEVVVRNEGDRLGAPPQNSPAFDMDAVDAVAGNRTFFAGWTEARPASGAEYVIGSGGDSVAFVGENTTVRRAMELFPVYEPVGPSVDSNIDSQASVPLERIRTIERVYPSGSEQANGSAALMLRAYPVDGYRFEGWYKGYGSDAQPTLVTTGYSYELSRTDLRASERYTAVFSEVCEVRYHGTDGAVLYTAKVDAAEGRTFVSTETGQDGSEYEVPIDAAAWKAIADELDAASKAPDARYVELFEEWQWVRADGSVAAWSDFFRSPIGQDMDLYPTTYRVSAQDDTGSDITEELWWALDSSGAGSLPVKAYCKHGYDRPKLVVHAAEAAYEPGSSGGAPVAQELPLAGVHVGLFVSPLSTDPLQKATDDAGDAVFEFDALLTVVKKTDDARAAGRAFSFTVTDAVTHERSGLTVEVGTTPDEAGMYVGSASLRLPAGRYIVTEDESPAWRYEPTFSLTGAMGDVTAGFDVTSPATVECRNGVVDDRWIDAAARACNVFAAQGPVPGGEQERGGDGR